DGHAKELRRLADLAREGMTKTTGAAELIPVMLDVMDRLWDLNSFGWSGPQALGWMCEAALRHFLEESGVEMDLSSILCGGTDSYTYNMAKSQQELGRSIQEPEVVDAFERLGLGEIVPHLTETSPESAFVRDFEAFCWRFGKTPPSWRGRPALWSFGVNDVQRVSAIKNALLGNSRDVRKLHVESLKTRQANEHEIRSAISNRGSSALERFDRLLEWARYWTQALNDRHGLTAGLLWEREIVWQTGTRLHREELLEEPEDLLVLKRADVETFAKTGDRHAWADAYARCRREYRRNRRLAPPSGIGAPRQDGDAKTDSEPQAASAHRAGQDEPLAGRGFGGGSVTGRARLIVNLLDPEVLESLSGDDVLVLPHELAFHYADWHSLLTLIKGVVSPGRPSHHLAQVARECGVPLIGEVTGDLAAISEGATIHIDGTTGVIEVV
ncbi:MAG: PEP-utilizing enzyme, partial [Planctomycetota bacterium]|nr:PEP-utilizing enzyme [Planctomycetota bacterium]